MKNLKLKSSNSSPSLLAVASKNFSTTSRVRSEVSNDLLSDGKSRGLLRKHSKRVVKNEKRGATLRYPYFIREDGVNHTPKPLHDPDFGFASEHFLSAPSAVKRTRRATDPQVSAVSSSITLTSWLSHQSRHSLGHVFSSDTESFRMSFASFIEEQRGLELRSSSVPSLFHRREDPPPKEKGLAFTFTVNLSETETMFHLSLPSCADSVETELGREIARSNSEYDRVLSTSRSLSHTATQTPRVFVKHMNLVIPRASRANSTTFASVWDIYDSYVRQERLSIQSTSSREEGEVAQIVDVRKEDNYTMQFEYLDHTFDSGFLNSLMVMERMISKDEFGMKQHDFQGLLVEDPLSLDAKCNYSLAHLWTFSVEETIKRKVTSMCWSSVNHNILAVGYGKFKYADRCDGLVCVWNVKNPRHPERRYQFKDPVTCVSFSEKRHQILAVGFYSGLVLLLDTVSRSPLVKATNSHYPLYYPVWQVVWCPHEPLETGQCLISCSQNGRVFRYKKNKFFTSKKIMTVSRPHGNVQGVYRPRKCFSRKIISRLNPSAEVLVLHPDDPSLYLVGTSEGCVYLCSVNYRHDYVDVFVAHSGPVYSIQFNPFCSKVLLTCGADYCVRVWAEGVTEPLMTLESGLAPVQGALWSPLHSTVIVTITANLVEVWDIRRRTSKPKSSTVSPSKSFNTVIHFSSNKHNLCVGDADGNVHVMVLTEMPFSPMFQEEVLAQSIQNALISHPYLLRRLVELGPPFFGKKTARSQYNVV